MTTIMIPGAGDACSVFPLSAISEPSRRQGSGLVEAEVGVLSFVTRCHCAPSLDAVMILEDSHFTDAPGIP